MMWLLPTSPYLGFVFCLVCFFPCWLLAGSNVKDSTLSYHLGVDEASFLTTHSSVFRFILRQTVLSRCHRMEQRVTISFSVPTRWHALIHSLTLSRCQLEPFPTQMALLFREATVQAILKFRTSPNSRSPPCAHGPPQAKFIFSWLSFLFGTLSRLQIVGGFRCSHLSSHMIMGTYQVGSKLVVKMGHVEFGTTY